MQASRTFFGSDRDGRGSRVERKLEISSNSRCYQEIKLYRLIWLFCETVECGKLCSVKQDESSLGKRQNDGLRTEGHRSRPADLKL